MKRILSFALCVVMLFSLVACGQSNDESVFRQLTNIIIKNVTSIEDGVVESEYKYIYEYKGSEFEISQTNYDYLESELGVSAENIAKMKEKEQKEDFCISPIRYTKKFGSEDYAVLCIDNVENIISGRVTVYDDKGFVVFYFGDIDRAVYNKDISLPKDDKFETYEFSTTSSVSLQEKAEKYFHSAITYFASDIKDLGFSMKDFGFTSFK